jgi:hypothetical protein
MASHSMDSGQIVPEGAHMQATETLVQGRKTQRGWLLGRRSSAFLLGARGRDGETCRWLPAGDYV